MDNIPKLKIFSLILFICVLANVVILDLLVLFNKPQNNLMISTDNEQIKDEVIDKPTEITPTITVVPNQYYEQVRTAQLREIYIPLGAGSTQNVSWISLDGVEASIDTSKYSIIKEAYFQATLRIPTGNGKVSAKLVNITDKHDVWFSEVESEGSTAILKEAKITLTPGIKTYRVYMKSSLNYEAFVDFARIKLIVEE